MKSIGLLTLPLLALIGCNNAPETTAATTNTAATAGAAVRATGQWIETVSKTPDGGMIMGNPAAKVKLVEYGAMSCGACANFTKTATPELQAMIAKGSVSYEFRPFLLNAMDVPASLLARCGGAGPFFPISEQLFEAQAEWLGRTQTVTPDEQAAFATMQPTQQTVFLAEKLDLVSFVQARGIGAEQARACLTDEKAIDELGKMTEVGQTKFNVRGTPTFVINGETIANTSNWEGLKPKLVAAGA